MKPSTIIAVFGLLVSPFSVIWKGHVFRCLWTWFAVPFGLPSIGIAQAIGIMLVVGFATWQWRYQEDAKDEEGKVKRLIEALLVAFFYPAFALLFGWVTLKFI